MNKKASILTSDYGAEIGRANDVQVTDQELQRAMFNEAMRYGPQAMQVVEFFSKNPQQMERFRGPIFEDKVIDHLLGAPEVREPVQLIQPGVFYEFADPELERLSAGQKIMVRMGYENMMKVKTKLREIRQALVAKAQAGGPGIKPRY